MKNKFLIITALTLITVMLAATVCASALTNQQQLNNINSQISAAQSQKSASQQEANSLTQKIGNLDRQINNTQASINKLQGEITKTLADIEAKKKELDVKSQEIATQNDALGNRLNAMYKNGNVGYIEVILGSKSFSEFLNNIDMVVEIYKQDEDFLKLLQKQYDELAETKKALEELNAKLETQQQELKSKQQSLEGDKASAEQLRAAAQADVNAQNELIDGLNESAKQIQFLIEEEQRKAREEAAARAAAEAAAKAAANKAAAAKSASNSKSSYSKSYSSGGTVSWSTSSGTTPSFSGSFGLPAPSYVRISSYYGYRVHPITGTYKLHTGIDFAAPSGSPCVASAAGTVIYSGWYSGYGYTVVIDHGDGISTLYGHNSSLLVSKGQSVAKGQQIAKIGSTGNSTGPHCHFEVRVNGQYTNPMPYLNGSK